MTGRITNLVYICDDYGLTSAQTLDVIKVVDPKGTTTKGSVSSIRSRRPGRRAQRGKSTPAVD